MTTAAFGPNETSSMSPANLAEPPPAGLELVVADRVVGWIEPGAIGFVGFGSADEAARAAWAAHRVVAQRLALRGREARVLPPEPGSLVVGPTHDPEAILADGERIATLVPPGPDSRSGPDGYGVALPVPPPTDEQELRATAHVVFDALRAAGVRWAMLAPEQQGEAREVRGDAARPPSPAPAARGAARRPGRSSLLGTPFRMAAAGVLGGAALIALVEWLVFRSSMAIGLFGVVLVLVPIAVLVDRRRGAAADVDDELPGRAA